MQALNAVKQACRAALASDSTESLERFHAAVDPAFILEMASAIDNLLMYVEKVDDLTAQELAREIRHRMRGDTAEGGV